MLFRSENITTTASTTTTSTSSEAAPSASALGHGTDKDSNDNNHNKRKEQQTTTMTRVLLPPDLDPGRADDPHFQKTNRAVLKYLAGLKGEVKVRTITVLLGGAALCEAVHSTSSKTTNFDIGGGDPKMCRFRRC